MADPQERVLVVDDEAYLADLVSMALRYEGFETATAGSVQEALRKRSELPPDLIVLDVMLPDGSGMEACGRLRGDRDVPVVFLTARGATEDRVAGLTVGGDDYIVKPFSLDELVARVHAVLRRTRGSDRTSAQLAFADLEIDTDAHEARRGGRRLELTPTEFKLLRYLAVNARRVLSQRQILDHVWEYDFGGNGNVVQTYISYLRRKVDAVGPPLIHTVPRVGYVLRHPRGADGGDAR